MSGARLQYRVARGKNDDIVEGPDDAEVVVTVSLADATLDPSVAFMLGKLKNTGPSGPLFDALSSGEVAAALARLVAQAG
ncbi:MAG: hypothetical protein ACO28Q_01215 [Ilumatobacteraceae bacterium]|jgi:hypothetical protein